MFARFKKLIFPGIAFVVAFAVSVSAFLGACQDTPKPASFPAKVSVSIPATVPPAVVAESTATPTTPPPITMTPAERDHVRDMLKDYSQGAFVSLGASVITEAEYVEACTVLRRNDWDKMKAYRDPERSGRLGAVVGSVNGAMEGINEWAEEEGIAKYTLADFCANVP